MIGALPELAARINEETHAAESHARSAVEHALIAGALLAQAKTLVPHGEWLLWIGNNCTVAPRTASAYMRLAKRVPELPGQDRQRVADLPLRDAIRAIGASGDAPEPTICVRPSRPDDADRISSALRSGSNSLRSASRDVLLRRGLTAARVERLQKRLRKLLDELDGLVPAEIEREEGQ